MGGRVEIQPDHIPDLGLQLRIGGELERLGLPGLEVVLGPHPGHGAVADPQFGGQQPTRPVGHAQRLGRWGQRGGQDLCPPVTANRLGTATAGSVDQAVGEPLPQVALTPGDDSWPGDIEPLGEVKKGRGA